jgi:hypothetical protein
MSKKSMTITMPELDNAAIRRTPDGRVSVYDLIKVVGTQKNPRDAWNSLCDKYPEVVGKTDSFKFSGRGQQNTPVTSREGAIYIIGLLPNTVGKLYRENAAKLVLRYLDADITLAAEVVDRNDNDEDLQWLESRLRGKTARKRFAGKLKSHGVLGRGYAFCTNQTYQGLYGTNAEGMRNRKNLSPKANWRDYATITELNQLAFTEDLTGKKLDKNNAQGNTECEATCLKTAKSVANFIDDFLAS